MRRMRSGGGWAAIKYTLRMANRVGWRQLWQAMRAQERLQDLRARHGRPDGRHGQRSRPLAGGLQEVAAGDGRRHAGRPRARVLRSATPSPSCETLSPRELEWCGRLTQPLYAGPGDTHYRVDRLGRRPRPHRRAAHAPRGPTRTFFYASGRSSNEAGFLLQLFARLFGTNYVNNCSYYCHQASGVGLRPVARHRHRHGHARRRREGRPVHPHRRQPGVEPSAADADADDTSAAAAATSSSSTRCKELGLVNFRVPSDVWQPAVRLEDRQPLRAAAHRRRHRPADRRRQAAARTRRSRSARSSTRPPRASTTFVDRSRATSWDDDRSGSPASTAPTIERDRRRATRAAKNAVFGWTMGITHHEHGVDNVRAIVNLALLRGMVGRPHAGLLPIRGHSQRAGHRLGGRRAEAEAADPRQPRSAARRQAAAHAGPRHDGLHGGRRPRAR